MIIQSMARCGAPVVEALGARLPGSYFQQERPVLAQLRKPNEIGDGVPKGSGWIGGYWLQCERERKNKIGTRHTVVQSTQCKWA